MLAKTPFEMYNEEREKNKGSRRDGDNNSYQPANKRSKKTTTRMNIGEIDQFAEVTTAQRPEVTPTRRTGQVRGQIDAAFGGEKGMNVDSSDDL